MRLKQSKPASRSTKENESPRLEGRDSSNLLPAGITSRPIPSPGIRPMRRLRRAMVTDGVEAIELWETFVVNARSR